MERRAFEGSAAEKGWHHRGGRRMKTPGEDPSVRTEGVTNGGKKIIDYTAKRVGLGSPSLSTGVRDYSQGCKNLA